MIDYLQKFLGRLGDFEIKHFYVVLIAVLVLTVVGIVGMTKVSIESDFSKFNPEGIPVLDLADELDKEFSSSSPILVIVQLDDQTDYSQVEDIRSPEVMEFLVRLENNLKKEQKVESVFSVGSIFQQGVPSSLEGLKYALSQIPQSESFFNKRYSMTPVFVQVDSGEDSDKIDELNLRIGEVVSQSGIPPGIKAVVTGEPPLFSAIFRLIIQDAFYTLIMAAVIIFFLLLVIRRSVRHSLMIMVPVMLGIIWTVGMLGWIGIPITIATAAMGAMLLGLGVEYSIFLNSRYLEEKRIHSTSAALINALSTTGASTVSSGVTTFIGFLALTLSAFPILSDMGFTLGLGIFFVLASTMVTGPFILILEDRIGSSNKGPKVKKIKRNDSIPLRFFERYGSFVSKNPITVIILALLITGFLLTGITRISNEDIDFDTTLPADLPELVAFNMMKEEFGDTFRVSFYVQLEPSEIQTNEPHDIRDPRVVNFISVLSEKAGCIDYATNVDSLSVVEKEANKGILPQSLAAQKELLETLDYSNLITGDFSGTVVRVEFDSDGQSHSEEIVRQVYELIETTEQPAGVKVSAVGGIIENHEVNDVIGSDSSRTAVIAFAVIVLFLFLISRSVRYTILPLVTVMVAIIWILGLIGYLQIPFNSIISSVISMTIGIGIDFGIQLSMRFRQELGSSGKRTAMKNTLKYTLYPMVVTMIAAVIGFKSMTLGELKIMENLGNTLILGMVSSMIVAVTLVAGLIVLFEKKRTRRA